MLPQEMPDTRRLLDIHTHRMEEALQGRAVLNYEIPLCGICNELQSCFYSAGIHPWQLTADSLELQLTALSQLLDDKRLLAIGEAGLDKLTKAPMALQMKAFERQIELSEGHQFPLIIHCVKAMEELLTIRKLLKPSQPWIWHGFRGKPQQAEQLLENGIYLSFGERYSDESIRLTPADSLFLETDESKLHIDDILTQAAQSRGEDTDQLRRNVEENIQRLFVRGC